MECFLTACMKCYEMCVGIKQSESARAFTIVNACKETIWPAIFPGQLYDGGGFPLKTGQSVVFNAPAGGWVGRIWARTGCKFDQAGNGTCQTGSCGTSMKCADPGTPPATLAEFNLASRDFYDVSLVDGFNLPVTIAPLHGTGNCSVGGCDSDMRSTCPSELALKDDGKTVACRSACSVYDSDEYCCRGTYNSPMTCQASNYTKAFKQACPAAYSYAYDDPTSLFTCTGADYVVAFCSDR